MVDIYKINDEYYISVDVGIKPEYLYMLDFFEKEDTVTRIIPQLLHNGYRIKAYVDELWIAKAICKDIEDLM